MFPFKLAILRPRVWLGWPLLVFLCAFLSECTPTFLGGCKDALSNGAIDEGWTIVAPDLLFSSLKEVTSQPIMGFDPLPPLDSIVSYTRPERYFLALRSLARVAVPRRCLAGQSEHKLRGCPRPPKEDPPSLSATPHSVFPGRLIQPTKALYPFFFAHCCQTSTCR